VKLWLAFHDVLPESNSNKMPVNLPAICPKSQMYFCSKELCSGISDADLLSPEGVSLIINYIYQRDSLSVVSEIYSSFNQLWNTHRGNTESMKNFESRFPAQVSTFNSISRTTKLLSA